MRMWYAVTHPVCPSVHITELIDTVNLKQPFAVVIIIVALFAYCSKIVIQDTSIVLSPADVKAYVIMTLKGLEFLHTHWILHRVSVCGCGWVGVAPLDRWGVRMGLLYACFVWRSCTSTCCSSVLHHVIFSHFLYNILYWLLSHHYFIQVYCHLQPYTIDYDHIRITIRMYMIALEYL